MDYKSHFAHSQWCQHYRKLRTNNDVEGWHTRLNMHCDRQHGKALSLYMLIDAKEAQLVELFEEKSLQHYTLRVKIKFTCY